MKKADNARPTLRPTDARTITMGIIAPLTLNEHHEHAAKLEVAVCEFMHRSKVVDMKMLYHLGTLLGVAEELLFEDDPQAAELADSAHSYVLSLMASLNMAQVVETVG